MMLLSQKGSSCLLFAVAAVAGWRSVSIIRIVTAAARGD